MRPFVGSVVTDRCRSASSLRVAWTVGLPLSLNVRYVNEDLIASLVGDDETKAAVIVPALDRAFEAHGVNASKRIVALTAA